MRAIYGTGQGAVHSTCPNSQPLGSVLLCCPPSAQHVLLLGHWLGVPIVELVVAAACVVPCLRAWWLQAMIMTDPADKLDPMSLLFYMSSFSVLLLLPTTLILEPGVFGEVSWAACAWGGKEPVVHVMQAAWPACGCRHMLCHLRQQLHGGCYVCASALPSLSARLRVRYG